MVVKETLGGKKTIFGCEKDLKPFECFKGKDGKKAIQKKRI